MKIITAGAGFVANHLSYPIVSDRILPNYKSIDDFLDTHKPDILINCIGFTGGPGRNIDGCEENKQKTFDTNTILPIMLASACEKRDIRVIQIGSGCIYYGASPNTKQEKCDCGTHCFCEWPMIDSGWKENDAANPVPLSTYSKSKYACDLALMSMKNVTTLRIRMPISWKREPRNLLSKLISYKKVVEIPNSVTFLDNELSRAVDWAIHREKTGVYHVCNPKPLTHGQILKEYQKYVPNHKFISITPKELENLVIATRSNCIIDSSKIINDGFIFYDAEEMLSECVRRYATNEK